MPEGLVQPYTGNVNIINVLLIHIVSVLQKLLDLSDLTVRYQILLGDKATCHYATLCLHVPFVSQLNIAQIDRRQIKKKIKHSKVRRHPM